MVEVGHSEFSHPLSVDLHQEVVEVVVSQPSSNDDLRAIEKLRVVIGCQGVDGVVRVTEVNVI